MAEEETGLGVSLLSGEWCQGWRETPGYSQDMNALMVVLPVTSVTVVAFSGGCAQP